VRPASSKNAKIGEQIMRHLSNKPLRLTALTFGLAGSLALEQEASAQSYGSRYSSVLTRPSRSTSIDLSLDDRELAMVNTDEGSVSFFRADEGSEERISRVASSRYSAQSEPVGVVIHPDQQRAFVANRATGTVSRIVDVRSWTPRVNAELEVGGEPVGLALNPTGDRLWVTNWVTGKVHIIATSTSGATPGPSPSPTTATGMATTRRRW
jgi:DNA-binding beta-propeller fold protein YncE